MSYTFSTDPPEYKLRQKLLWFLLLMLLTGCGESAKEKRDKYQATLPSDNGKVVEVNGEKFRIVYIGGVRFRFPDTNQFRSVGGDSASSPTHDGIDLDLYRPVKVPGVQSYKWFYGNIEKSAPISVQVRGRTEPKVMDRTKNSGLLPYMHPLNYIVHDDIKLGLRIFRPKDFPDMNEYAYPLIPLEHELYIIYDDFIEVIYAPKVDVKIDLMHRTREIHSIPSDWKEIYLDTVNILNKYREDKK
jgi:hypothetical protein